MKRILSKILLICAVCISLVAGNAQTANAEPPVKFYFCSANTDYTLVANAKEVCIFTPSEIVPKVTLNFTSNDPYNPATLDIDSPVHFHCAKETVIVPNGGTEKVTCNRNNVPTASITVQFDTLNKAGSVKVKMKEEDI
ncbi:MAG: hypothetical protein KME31_20480 [Tolypothrix carrinoi HA7290-LM1]|jgi:hypothetical protein|nr:hypothetical protein [Tolypothrix carrinoi HA7290-LM1]